MNRAAMTLVAALGLVVAAILVQTLTGNAATGPATVRITDRQTQVARVDVGRQGRTPGDMEIFNSLVYNQRVTPRPLGHSEFVCTYTIGINRSCQGTIFLPKGKLMVGGVLRYRQFYELAVIGGTGLYDNARGTLTVTRIGDSPPRHLLFFRLAG